MKISPVSPLGSTVQSTDAHGSAVNTMRALKMSTNATPGHFQAENTQELSIPDDNEEQNEAVVEATQPISPQFAALAKQRRAIQQERMAFNAEKKAFEDTRSQGSDSVPRAQLKAQPLKELLDAGVTYEQLTEAILGNQGNPEINALKAEIAALKDGVDQKFTDRETQAERQVLAEMQREATSLVAQGDDFELVRETRSVPDVMQLIERTYKETGEVLDVSEALSLVEEELFKRNQKLVSLKKMRGLFTQPEPAAQQQRAQGMRTLTNKDTASVPATAKQRAMAAFYGTLKK